MQIQALRPKGLAAPSSDYSHALRVACNQFLVISGQVPLDAGGSLVGKGDFEAQVRQVYDNLQLVLHEAQADFSNVVQFTTYLTHYGNVRKYARLRHDLFQQFFAEGLYPAHTLLVVTSLGYPQYLIEVEALAALQ